MKAPNKTDKDQTMRERTLKERVRKHVVIMIQTRDEGAVIMTQAHGKTLAKRVVNIWKKRARQIFFT